MRLSDAMMLGSVTCRLEKYNWNSCALGCAGNAIGIPNWGNMGYGRASLILEVWPWLRKWCPPAKRLYCDTNKMNYQFSYASQIVVAFDWFICEGSMSLERLIDWVRSVEPQPLALPAPAVVESVEAVEEMTAAL